MGFRFGYLTLRVNYRAERYLLSALPFLVILAFSSLLVGFRLTRAKLSTKLLAPLVAIAILAATGMDATARASVMSQWRQSVVRRESDMRVAVGEWLVERYPSTTRIFYDSYVYVPPIFADVTRTLGGTVRSVQSVDPDIVIVTAQVSARYADVHLAGKFVDGTNAFREHYEYYEALKSGRMPYALERDFGTVQVYRKASAQTGTGQAR